MAKNVIKVDDLLQRNSRNTVLYFNYDNEAFMNTGIQESGSTPFGASTTTGPALKKIPGKVGIKQDIVNPFAFLGLKSAFIATASIAYPMDFIGKVIEAMKTPGGGFIQAYAPCPRGWRSEPDQTDKHAKLAVDSGYFPLITIRIKDGVPKYSYSRPLEFNKEKFVEYLKEFGKFRHLFKPQFLEDKIDEVINQAEARMNNIKGLVKEFGAENPEDFYQVDFKKLKPQEHIVPGHGLCPGCGAGAVLNQLTVAASQVAGNNILYFNNTCCVEVATSKDNFTSWNVSWMHQLFESGSTMADGVSVAKRIMYNKGLIKEVPYVIHIGGDGSTYDIGYQFLKSALVRSSSSTIQNENLKI